MERMGDKNRKLGRETQTGRWDVRQEQESGMVAAWSWEARSRQEDRLASRLGTTTEEADTPAVMICLEPGWIEGASSWTQKQKCSTSN